MDQLTGISHTRRIRQAQVFLRGECLGGRYPDLTGGRVTVVIKRILFHFVIHGVLPLSIDDPARLKTGPAVYLVLGIKPAQVPIRSDRSQPVHSYGHGVLIPVGQGKCYL